MPIVHDEAATYFYYINSFDFLPFYAHWDANNHILNSALSALTYYLFGSAEWSLRLPNVLSSVFYFYYVYKLSGFLRHSYLKYFFSSTLLLSHYFLEFFALTRGYGMSMAFLMGALYFFIQSMSSQKVVFQLNSAVYIILACLANLTLFNTFSLMFIYGLVLYFISFKGSLKDKGFLFYGLLIVLVLLFFAYYGIELKRRGLLYYGGLSGFWTMTVETLLLYIVGEFQISGILTAVIFLVWIFFFIKLYVDIKNIRSFLTQPVFFIGYLLLANIGMTLFLGHVLATNFPEDRTGLYFFPLFVMALFYTLDQISYHKMKAFVLVFVFFPIHFLCKANLIYTSFWYMEYIPPAFYSYMENFSEDKLPASFGGYYSDESIWAYYRSRNKTNSSSQVQWSDFQTNIADYAIFRAARNQKIPPIYDTVIYDSISEKTLIKRRNSLQKKLYKHYLNISVKSDQEHYNFCELSAIDDLKNKSIYVLFDFQIEAPSGYFPSFVVVSATDSSGKDVFYERVQFHWYFQKQSPNIYFAMYSKALPENMSKLTIYLWNIEKKSFEIKKGKVSIFELSEPEA